MILIIKIGPDCLVLFSVSYLEVSSSVTPILIKKVRLLTRHKS